MDPKLFFAELKRRNVYKVAVAYGVLAWLLIQAGSILFPTFEAPAWAMKIFVVVIVLGFPIALILAWAFELTPEGIKRTEEVTPDESITRRTGRKLDFLIIGVLLAVITLFTTDRFRQHRQSAERDISEKSYARTGENDLALPLIEHYLTHPGGFDNLEESITLPDLRLRWQWDPLRKDPRFQKLLAGPEQKPLYQ